MGRLIGIGSSHEGVGNTTTAVNLAVLLARSGRRTLLVDVHPELRATRHLIPLEGEPAPWGWEEGLPAAERQDLAVAPMGAGPGEPPSLTAGWRSCGARWAFGIVDLPRLAPESAGWLEALDSMILTVPPAAFSLSGLAEAFGVITDVKAHRNPELRLEGVLVTQSDVRLERFERTMLAVARHFPVDVYEFAIPKDPAMRRLGERGTVVEAAPGSRAARGYVELAMEVLKHG